jgi:hypothetical protein
MTVPFDPPPVPELYFRSGRKVRPCFSVLFCHVPIENSDESYQTFQRIENKFWVVIVRSS